MRFRRGFRPRAVLRVTRCEPRELPVVNPFTIVALPDTQYYSQYANLAPIFAAQTQWVVNNRVTENIAFVTHLGDIVQNGATGTNQNLTEWQRADAAIDILDGNLAAQPDGVLPYSVALGNHDYNVVNSHASGATRYIEFFGPQRYAGRSWYGGHYQERNHYQFFTGGGRRFLHLTLEWEAPDDVIDWARQVLRANPGLPTILSTHSYVFDGSLSRRVVRQSEIGNSGEAIFRKLVYNNPQIFMVLNGHFQSQSSSSPGEHAQVSTNAAGLPVFEMLSDYQNRPNQDSGLMRLIRFDPAANQIQVRTYSPNYNVFETDANSQFSFNVDFANRFRAILPDPVNVSAFQDGVNHGFGTYQGTHDTMLQQANPATVYGSVGGDLVVADAGGSATASQALLRFDQILGTGPGQIAPGARILSATLHLDSNDPGAGGRLYRMVAPWTENSTWLSLGFGVQANGVEARAAFESQAGFAGLTPVVPADDMLSVNVTADVAAWAAGAANHGWSILAWPGATDAWGFSSSEFATPALRPRLRVEWLPPAPRTRTAEFQNGVAGYAGTTDTDLRQAAATSPNGSANRIIVDGPNPADARHALLRFNDLFGPQAGRVPANARIDAAYLYLTTPYFDVNAPGGGATLHMLRRPWDNQSTWAGTFGGDGVQADDADADAVPVWNTGSVDFGQIRVDVTSSVRAWQAGRANYGWALLPNNTDGWQIASSEAEAVAERPRLVIVYANEKPAEPVRKKGDAV